MIFAGKGVHVVTVNDYLARRDSEWVGQVPRFLGMQVCQDSQHTTGWLRPARICMGYGRRAGNRGTELPLARWIF
jgi:hypothetical protein